MEIAYGQDHLDWPRGKNKSEYLQETDSSTQMNHGSKPQ